MRQLPRYEFDQQYVDRLVAEDPEVEQHFTRYFGDLLTVKLRSRLRSAALVEDARQETFVRVLTALKQKRSLVTPETLGAFVNSVCTNVVFEMYRSGSRTTPMPDDFDTPDQQRPAADALVMVEEERAGVRAALEALPPKERDLLRALFLEERDKDEICRALAVDRNYLRVLLHRARLRFRELYEGEEAAARDA